MKTLNFVLKNDITGNYGCMIAECEEYNITHRVTTCKEWKELIKKYESKGFRVDDKFID